ncbi:unnamed protein product [Ectocarpus sp. 12 AP-2014]
MFQSPRGGARGGIWSWRITDLTTDFTARVANVHVLNLGYEHFPDSPQSHFLPGPLSNQTDSTIPLAHSLSPTSWLLCSQSCRNLTRDPSHVGMAAAQASST